MTAEFKSVVIRLGVLILPSIAWFILLSPALYNARIRNSATYKFEYPDVSITFEPDGWQHVRAAISSAAKARWAKLGAAGKNKL